MEVTEVHEEKLTLAVDVNIPGHAARGSATPLFEHSRQALIEREGGKCWVTGLTAAQLGEPLEAHHFPIERCFAEGIDWQRFARDCRRGDWGPHAAAFDWDRFFLGAKVRKIEAPEQVIPASHYGPSFTIPARVVRYLIPVDPYLFVDDMRVNGRLMGKRYHTAKDQGVHTLPEPIWLAQKYMVEGYRFSAVEVIHHAQET